MAARRPTALRSRAALVLALLVPCATAGVSAHAEVFRWVDDKGVVNYSQQEPRDQDATRIGKRTKRKTTSTAPPALPAAPTEADLSTTQQSILDELEVAEEQRQAAIKKVRQSNCTTSKLVLDKLQNNGRLRIRDDAGDEVVMTEEDRIERIRQAHKSIAMNCESVS